jgi:LysM repeat protein
LLAPAALAVCVVAFFAVILSSGSESEKKSTQASETSKRSAQSKQKSRRRRAGRSTYTVKVGDTLAGIAQKTGITVEQLQERNPELDPQGLVSGQKIKLRE